MFGPKILAVTFLGFERPPFQECLRAYLGILATIYADPRPIIQNWANREIMVMLCEQW